MPKSKPNKVQEFQRKIYLKAKQNPNYRFYALYDKVYRKDILKEAWERVKRNRGGSGIDGMTIKEVNQYPSEKYLEEIAKELKTRTYRPKPLREVLIPKLNGKKRALRIPTIKDRIVQQATKIVIEPIFEADFQPTSYGFRPKQSAQMAIKRLNEIIHRTNKRKVIDLDLKNFFDTIPHKKLIHLIVKRIVDRGIINLIKMWLKADILTETGINRNSITGTPQGGVISPLLANIYLNQLDKFWEKIKEKFHNTEFIRYADDIVILCSEKANAYFRLLEKILVKMSLSLNQDKTSILDLEKQSLDFLGFNLRRTNSRKTDNRYTRITPSKKAIQTLKDKVKIITYRGNKQPIQDVITRINISAKGWRNYYNIGYQSESFTKVNDFLRCRVRKFLKRRKNKAGQGWKEYNYDFLYKKLGLYQLKV